MRPLSRGTPTATSTASLLRLEYRSRESYAIDEEGDVFSSVRCGTSTQVGANATDVKLAERRGWASETFDPGYSTAS